MDSIEKKENTTAITILKAAQEIFIEKGFDGSSINEIAAKAQVNKSLIYHHFENKRKLWQSVKAHLIHNSLTIDFKQGVEASLSFKEFLSQTVTLRFQFYDQNPQIARLISWQRLENEPQNLQGLGFEDTLITPLKEFQMRGEIRPDLDLTMIIYLIMTTVSMPFMDKPAFFQGSDKQNYLNTIIDLLYRSLT